MTELHPTTQKIGAAWLLLILLALLASPTSASAGRMEGVWVGVAMGGGFAMVGAVYVAVIHLPASLPLLVRRLIMLAGMAGSMWGVGQVTRAVFALVG